MLHLTTYKRKFYRSRVTLRSLDFFYFYHIFCVYMVLFGDWGGGYNVDELLAERLGTCDCICGATFL